MENKIGDDSDVFTLYIYSGGAYIEEPEPKYVGGNMEHFDWVLASKINVAFVLSFGHLLGCDENASYRYRIPTIDGSLRVRQIDSEEDVMDMAAIGIQTGKVELYIVQEFHVRSIEPTNNMAVSERDSENEEKNLLYVAITFDEFCGNEEVAELPVDVTKVDWGKTKKGKQRGANVIEKYEGADNETEPELEETDSGESFMIVTMILGKTKMT